MFSFDINYLSLDDTSNEESNEETSSDNDDHQEISSDDWDIQPENDILEKSDNSDEDKLRK